VVSYVHANQGAIQLRIQNGYELEELHNVAISSVANADLLSYEASTSLWKNKSYTTLGIATQSWVSTFLSTSLAAYYTKGQVDSILGSYAPIGPSDSSTYCWSNNQWTAITIPVAFTGNDVSWWLSQSNTTGQPTGYASGRILSIGGINGLEWIDPPTGGGSGITTADVSFWLTQGSSYNQPSGIGANKVLSYNGYDLVWVDPTFYGIGDAPNDGTPYVRINNTWSAFSNYDQVGSNFTGSDVAYFLTAGNSGNQPTNLASGYVLSYNGSSLEWISPPAGSGGGSGISTSDVSYWLTQGNSGNQPSNISTGRVLSYNGTNLEWIDSPSGGGGGGIGDAPFDGTNYVRNNGSWVSAVYVINDVLANLVGSISGAQFPATQPADGQYLAWNLGQNRLEWRGVPIVWGAISGNITDQSDLQTALSGKYDASNPNGYVDATYVTTQGYLTDAPADGQQYARQNGIWQVVSGGGGGSVNWGSIGGNITDQSDLNSALSAKYDASNPSGFIGEAPTDDKAYARKSAGWSELNSRDVKTNVYQENNGYYYISSADIGTIVMLNASKPADLRA